MDKSTFTWKCFGFICSCVILCAGFVAAQTTGPELLSNPGFEGSYAPVPVQFSSAVITGVLPENWTDSSSPTSGNVKYSSDGKIPHGGVACLKIEVTNLQGGTSCVGQSVSDLVKGHTYNLSIWERGNSDESVAFGLSAGLGAAGSFGEESAPAGNSWMKLSTRVTAPMTGPAFFYFEIKSNETVWIDDASLMDSSPPK